MNDAIRRASRLRHHVQVIVTFFLYQPCSLPGQGNVRVVDQRPLRAPHQRSRDEDNQQAHPNPSVTAAFPQLPRRHDEHDSTAECHEQQREASEREQSAIRHVVSRDERDERESTAVVRHALTAAAWWRRAAQPLRLRPRDGLRLHGLRLRGGLAQLARVVGAARWMTGAELGVETGALRTGAGCVRVTGGGSGATAPGGGSGDGVAARAGKARTTHSRARPPAGVPLRRSNDHVPCRAISPRSPGLSRSYFGFSGVSTRRLAPQAGPEPACGATPFVYSARDLPFACFAASCSAADRPIAC